WGLFSAQRPAVGPPKLSAQMNYLLIPMLFALNKKESAPRALQRLQYPEAGSVSATDFVQLISHPLDIDAFVAAAFGFKLLRELSYELAYQNLCRASTLLQAIEQRSLGAGTRQNIAELRVFAVSSAARAIDAARADANYSKTGILRLQDSAHPCS